jgi:hypothetical protein
MPRDDFFAVPEGAYDRIDWEKQMARVTKRLKHGIFNQS